MQAITNFIRTIPDFPEPGIQFRDITPLLGEPGLLQEAVSAMVSPFTGEEITAVAGMEARGFIFGVLAAQLLGVGFVPLRKPGKLPYTVESVSYELEYGSATLEVHSDAVGEKDRVLLVDDLIATGGTARASCQLLEKLGATVAGCTFLIELADLHGREHLSPCPVHSLVHY